MPGYCYVCACRYDGKTFIAALLACGWPPSKTYKWQDCRTLLNWGKEHFNHEEIIGKNFPLKSITVTDGLEKKLPVSIHDTCRLLLRKEDLVNVVINTPDSIAAPVFTGDIVGSVCVYVNDGAFIFYTCLCRCLYPPHRLLIFSQSGDKIVLFYRQITGFALYCMKFTVFKER